MPIKLEEWEQSGGWFEEDYLASVEVEWERQSLWGRTMIWQVGLVAG